MTCLDKENSLCGHPKLHFLPHKMLRKFLKFQLEDDIWNLVYTIDEKFRNPRNSKNKMANHMEGHQSPMSHAPIHSSQPVRDGLGKCLAYSRHSPFVSPQFSWAYQHFSTDHVVFFPTASPPRTCIYSLILCMNWIECMVGNWNSKTTMKIMGLSSIYSKSLRLWGSLWAPVRNGNGGVWALCTLTEAKIIIGPIWSSTCKFSVFTI